MIHVVTITQSDGRVRIIPVDADDIIDAAVRAAKFLPFVTVGWTAYAEAQSDADCIKNADLLAKLVQRAYDDLCDKSDGNDYVSHEAFAVGVAEYNRTWDAVCAVIDDSEEETRRDEKRGLYGQHEDTTN